MLGRRIDMSQKDLIRKYLEDGGNLTNMSALMLWSMTCLTQRVFDLREEGLDIVTEMIYKKGGKRYARYTLKAA
jgi:hypothetical protein